jgi:hypothetical protein
VFYKTNYLLAVAAAFGDISALLEGAGLLQEALSLQQSFLSALHATLSLSLQAALSLPSQGLSAAIKEDAKANAATVKVKTIFFISHIPSPALL